MGWQRTVLAVLGVILVSAGLAFPQLPSRFLRDDPAPEPADGNVPAEFYFARMRYRMYPGDDNWVRRGGWWVDAPKAERIFLRGLRRLTRLDSRSVEHLVDLETDDIFNYPWAYVVEAGHWDLSEGEARRLREYLDRGGFLMTDDFHGTYQWGVFMESLRRAFPDRQPVDLDSSDPVFHVLYDLEQRYQVPGIVMFQTGRTYEYDGIEPKWRAVRDDRGRVVMAICHNMDLGDAWEWADAPEYPERYAALAYRVGINYVMYAMTH